MAQSAFAARRAAAAAAVPNEPGPQILPSEALQVTTKVQGHTDRRQKDSTKDASESRRKRRKLEDSAHEVSLTQRATISSLEEDIQRRLVSSTKQRTTQSQASSNSGHVEPATTEETIPKARTQDSSKIAKQDDDYEVHWNDDHSDAEIKLAAGQSLAISGVFDLWLKKGSVGILGATLHASSRTHRIYAPTTHALPSIEALRNPYGPSQQTAEFTISSCSTGIQELRRCDPRFGRIWGNENEDLATFTLITKVVADDGLLLHTGEEWQLQTARLLSSSTPPVVVICGPKGAGKSTFARYLSNSVVSKRFADTGIGYLDLDPGQPEYTTPAELSLHHITTFNLGPAFTHPATIPRQGNKLIRQHHFGQFSPRHNSRHYLACVRDLHGHYIDKLRPQGCPLVINTCGWVQGLGLDLLVSLVEELQPSHVLCLTAGVNDDTFSTLQQVTTRTSIEFQAMGVRTTSVGSRSAADLRAMQTCSYFHLDDSEAKRYSWQMKPVLKEPSLSLPYAGDQKLIAGVLLLGDQINPDMLEDAIDKTVLVIVTVEDQAALDGALVSTERSEDNAANMDIRNQDAENQEELEEGHEEDSILSTTNSYRLDHNTSGLPYLSHGYGANPPLDPTKTRCLGQVLLNSIHHDSQTFRIHTNLSLDVLTQTVANGTPLILVRGQLGMPDWAYLEDYVQAKATQDDIIALQAHEKLDGNSSPPVADEDLDFDVAAWADRTPYVEYQRDGQGKRNKNKVRRVRRNLGK